MNSWHSFSPNGRWLVFSSKARSPYTQMYLTHIDAQGNSSPAILIDNATAANRAVNIPEFVNMTGDGIEDIQVPAVALYKLMDEGMGMEEKGENDEALAIWKKAVAMEPENAKAQNGLVNFCCTFMAMWRRDSDICGTRCASTRFRRRVTTCWEGSCWTRCAYRRRCRS